MKTVSSVFLSLLIGCVFLYGEDMSALLGETGQYKNVIVLIPDGCGVAHMTITRWFNGAPLVQDSMDVSLVHTHSANSMITGSAAAATAFATGYKTWEGPVKARCISVRPDSILMPEPIKLPYEQQWRPVATVLEGARLVGKSVGLVATCRVSHATPAAFASHWYSRTNENVLMEQLVYQNIDVVFGGGFRQLIDSSMTTPGSTRNGQREDGENLHQVLVSNGYSIISTRDELTVLSDETQKVWGIFAENHMSHDIDRHRYAQEEPSLAEMTEKAIKILSKDPDGFFLVVEGSQVDWSSHANDPVGTITEYIAFDEAVRIAVDFARANPDKPTLILVFPDHDNGGMSLGRTNIGYIKPHEMVDFIKKASLTADAVAYLIYSNSYETGPDSSAIHGIIANNFGFDDITAQEMDAIIADLNDTLSYNLTRIIGHMLSERAGIGWTTNEHTGHDVPMFSYGFERAPRTIDNTDIACLCAHALGFDLEDINKRLFEDAKILFRDASVIIDTAGVETSMGQLIVEKNNKKAVFPFFKNIMVIEQDTIPLEGLTVYSLKVHKVFVPKQAKEFF